MIILVFELAFDSVSQVKVCHTGSFLLFPGGSVEERVNDPVVLLILGKPAMFNAAMFPLAFDAAHTVARRGGNSSDLGAGDQ